MHRMARGTPHSPLLPSTGDQSFSPSCYNMVRKFYLVHIYIHACSYLYFTMIGADAHAANQAGFLPIDFSSYCGKDIHVK